MNPTALDDTPSVESPWSRPTAELLETLEVSAESGLTAEEAARRLEAWGANQLRRHTRRGFFEILVDQFRSVVVLLLVAAAVVSLLFGAHLEAVAIGVVLVLNAAIGLFTELRAVRSMESLRELGTVETTVVRDGEVRRITAEEVVPGDLVRLEGGDVVTADVRLLESSRLQADESVLTGESLPVEKDPEAVPAGAGLAERTSMLFKGTAVTRGSGTGVVTATGMATELGEISALVEEAEEEITPLEERLAMLARRLVWITLALAAVILGAGLAAGKSLHLMAETAIALAVAAIPEGLPIVATLALARGMWRMARRNALVERLSAVETLGSTTVILTDKTGTLTENRMRVERVVLPAEGGAVPEEAAEKTSEETADEVSVEATDGDASPEGDDRRSALLRTAMLCSNAELGEDDEGLGDPTEVALVRAARDAGLDPEAVRGEEPREREVAFDPEIRMMATFHGRDGARRVAVKGGPEAVLEVCDRVRGPEGVVEMDDEIRSRWEARNRALAEDGLRVLAVATREADDPDEDPYRDLVLLGLVGLHDPPREDVRAALEACYGAGIRVVVVTGDQAETARNVAAAVGLRPGVGAELESAGLEVHAGEAIRPREELSPEEEERLRRAVLFARTDPAQKMRLLAMHQDAGEVVAMIGDGVNDAPALRQADIGVAMGRRGTQVAREASDLVLQDDRFATIVAAVDQGRVIFDNIRKFVVYLLSCNASEIMAVSVATVAGAPLPVLPLQILFLNLVTDVFPALALAANEGDPTVMDRPPRDPAEGVMVRRHWTAVAVHGAVLTAVVLAALGLALGPLDLSTTQAVSVSFLTLATSQILHVFNMAEPEAPVFRNDVTRNPWVWGAVVLCGGLVAAAAYLAPLSHVLEVTAPGAAGWALVGGMSVLPLVLGRAAHVVLRLSPGLRQRMVGER